jgi:hypothetical protein
LADRLLDDDGRCRRVRIVPQGFGKGGLIQAGLFIQVLEGKTESFELSEKPVASKYFRREDSFFLVFLLKFLTPPSGKGLKRKWMKTF